MGDDFIQPFYDEEMIDENPLENTYPSYAQAIKKNQNENLMKLDRTLLCKLSVKANINDILASLEDEDLDDEIEGVQLIKGNTILELSLKNEKTKMILLEKGLNIKEYHHRLFNSTPTRQMSKRTTVSILGLPLEAKGLPVGEALQQMGYGKHLLTRAVMKETPKKKTKIYSGIMIAVMENMKPIPRSIKIRGYYVRPIYTGQEYDFPQEKPATVEDKNNNEKENINNTTTPEINTTQNEITTKSKQNEGSENKIEIYPTVEVHAEDKIYIEEKNIYIIEKEVNKNECFDLKVAETKEVDMNVENEPDVEDGFTKVDNNKKRKTSMERSKTMETKKPNKTKEINTKLEQDSILSTQIK
jgi:hypothetical protein